MVYIKWNKKLPSFATTRWFFITRLTTLLRETINIRKYFHGIRKGLEWKIQDKINVKVLAIYMHINVMYYKFFKKKKSN